MTRRRKKSSDSERLQALQAFSNDLGLTIDDHWLRLLDQALTTAAWAKVHGGQYNERLEWFGDAVWDHASIEFTLEKCPNQQNLRVIEAWRIRLASGGRQSRLARQMGLEALVRIPDDYVAIEHGRKLETRGVLLGSALEAMIGAIAISDVKTAVNLSKTLMCDLLDEVHGRPADFIRLMAGTVQLSSRQQFLALTRLKMFMTREIIKTGCEALTLRGLHDVREHAMSVHALSGMARRLGLAEREHTDQQAMERLLAAIGLDPKLTPHVKAGLATHVAESIRAIEKTRGYVRVASETVPASALGDLETCLNGNIGAICFDARAIGKEIRVVCRFKGKTIAEGSGPDFKQARETAALAILNNSAALEEVRRDSHK